MKITNNSIDRTETKPLKNDKSDTIIRKQHKMTQFGKFSRMMDPNHKIYMPGEKPPSSIKLIFQINNSDGIDELTKKLSKIVIEESKKILVKMKLCQLKFLCFIAIPIVSIFQMSSTLTTCMEIID